MTPRPSPSAEVPAFVSHLGWLLLIFVAFAAVLTSCANETGSQTGGATPWWPPGSPTGSTTDGGQAAVAAGKTVYLYHAAKASPLPIAKLYYEFDTLRVGSSVYVALIFSEDFVDNTYGANSSTGYRKDKGHKFRDLVGSDHAIIGFEDAEGELMYEVKLDYITEDAQAPSGYRSGGIADGDGDMEHGSEDVVLHARSSLDHNLNDLGCVYLEDSPVAPDCPDWERRVIYEVWLDADLFGPAGFGQPVLDHVHASPSRMDSTVPVEPGEPPEGCVPQIDGASCSDGSPEPPDPSDPGELDPAPPITVE